MDIYIKMKRYTNHHDAAKAVIALLIVLVAFFLFLFLNSYSDVIYKENGYNAFYIFAILATVASGLLIGLLYVVSNSRSSVKKSTKSTKKHKKSRK